MFFSNGQTTHRTSVITATKELSALGISPAVFAFDDRFFLDESFLVRSSLDNFLISKIVVLTRWDRWA